MTTTMSISHITAELVNNPTILIYSLVNGLYNITIESIKLILDVEQFGVSNNLIVPTPITENGIFSLYASLLRHSMDSTEMPFSIFQPRIHHEV